MKLQFDPNQTFQLDAVAAVTDLFDGQLSAVVAACSLTFRFCWSYGMTLANVG